MDKEDLKKSTCINLRCVTQSSKAGVPLNQLQDDYKQLLGVSIPFKDLGYKSLENFLCDIPDVICLKRKTDGTLIAEGVADASTAHIAKLISKQKSSKKSKSGSSKPAIVTRKWGSSAKKNSHQKLKSSQKDFNNIPPGSCDRKHEQFMHLTPAQEESKKSVLINLRSVVQSCKNGVPLNRLQNDYRKFIGSSIPFENLGYKTLYEFIESIPDIIELKKDANEQLIAIGVVDGATAHLFGDPLKPIASKHMSPPTEPSTLDVKNKAAFQITSEPKAEYSSFFKLPQNNVELSDLNSVLKHSVTKKRVRKKKQLVNSVSEGLLENKGNDELIKLKLLKSAEPVTRGKENSATEVSLSKTDSISYQNQNKPNKSSNQNSPVADTFQHTNTNPTTVQLTFNGPNQPEKAVNCEMFVKSSDQDESTKSSKSSVASNKEAVPNFMEIHDTLCSERVQKVQNQIRMASISHLVWMHFLLYGPSKQQTLRKNIVSFHGFPFSPDSNEWQGKINLISQLPKKVLQQCLCLLCIGYKNKDTKGSLRKKLIDSLVAYTVKSGTEAQEIEQENVKKELYASNLTLSSVSSDVLSKCSSYCDTETSDKNVDASKIIYKTVLGSDSDTIDKQNILTGSHYNLHETKKSIQVKQSNDKGNWHTTETSAAENWRTKGTYAAKNWLTKETCAAENWRTKEISVSENWNRKETSVAENWRTQESSASVNRGSKEISVAENWRTQETSASVNRGTKEISVVENWRNQKTSASENWRTKETSASENWRTQETSASEKVASVLEEKQPLNKKEDVEECSKTETSSIGSSKKAKRKRRRKRRKNEIAGKNIESSVSKPVKASTGLWNQMQKLKKEQNKLRLLLSSALKAEIPN